MRDVLTVINGILFANSLSKALSQGLPAVLQRHLDLLQQAVQRQLAPGAQAAGEGSSSPLQGQVRAVLPCSWARTFEATVCSCCHISLPVGMLCHECSVELRGVAAGDVRYTGWMQVQGFFTWRVHLYAPVATLAGSGACCACTVHSATGCGPP